MPNQIAGKRRIGAGPLFRKIKILRWISDMNIIQDIDISSIKMECRAINILSSFRIFEDVHGIIRLVTIMVVQNNFCTNAGCPEGWSEMIFDEVALLRRGHQKARIIARMQRFVLWRYRIDCDSVSFHRLDIFDKILSIHAVILSFQASTNTAPVILHPDWR